MDPSASASDPELRDSARPPRPGRGGLLGALGVAAVALFSKLKVLLVLLKGIKIAKLLLTMASMFAMIWFEAARFGWPFGVGFVLLILIHELGHGVAIRRAGLAAGYPVFIPFFGAFISLKGQIRSPIVEADIALAGPIAGAAASAGCVALYFATQGRLWLALANSGFFLNLFNMTPVAPLDGGRAARVFSRKAWLVGLALLAGLFALTTSPQLILIGVLAATHSLRRAGSQAAGSEELVAVSGAARRNVAYNYFGLCAFLALGAYLTNSVLARG
jgi:Zn-dependent protease